MRVAISGASGLVGSALRTALEARGDRVLPMVRPKGSPPAGDVDVVEWAPREERLDPVALNGIDAVVHLAGESIAGGAWTAARRRRIRDSRVSGTRTIARALASAEDGPSVLVSASAIGVYGDRGDEVLDESAGPGDGFLADVCVAWEAAADPAREAGIRVVHPRIGLVLAGAGGLLHRMATPFRLGLGGRLGDGRQWMSWVALDDLVGALVWLLDHEIEGPVNAVAPHPARNAEFTRVLAEAVRRPAVLPVPSFALRLLPGGMGEELLLASARVRAGALEESGYPWRWPVLAGALEAELARRA